MLSQTEKAKQGRVKAMQRGYEKALEYRQEQIERRNKHEIMFRDILDYYGLAHQYQYILVYSYKFYIIDFVLEIGGLKIAIEIDGSSHDDKQVYDETRQSILELYGFFVMRFTTSQLEHDKDSVIKQLETYNIIKEPVFDPNKWLL